MKVSVEMLPRLHVVDDTKVVLVATEPSLHLVEEIAQLHEDDQTRHGQPDVTEKLWKETWRSKYHVKGRQLNQST